MSVVSLPHLGTLAFALASAAGCAASARVAGPTDLAGARLTLMNPTGDTYSVSVGGTPRGSVTPGARLTVTGLAPGDAAVLASNDTLRLAQRQVVTLVADAEATFTLRRQLARLRVVNHRAVPVELLIDGVSVGWAAPSRETVLEGVPAGQRTIVAESGSGPGAVRAERYLAEDEETSWAVPALVGAVGTREVPHPPPGQGLIWMHNTSTFDVHVFIAGEEVSLVAAGATAEIVVAPGIHQLVVRMEGVDAASEHEVTLLPNQTAEWDYRGP